MRLRKKVNIIEITSFLFDKIKINTTFSARYCVGALSKKDVISPGVM